MKDIPDYETFVKIEPIDKGLSEDKKYYAETADGRRMFLRVSDISELARKKAEYSMMERVHNLGVLTSKPIGFGLCNGGNSCYALSGWLDGEDLDLALPKLAEAEQYLLGIKASGVLKKIHTLPIPDDAEPWAARFWRKVQKWIDFYNAHSIMSANAELIIRHLTGNRHLLNNRAQTFIHGDFNSSNLIAAPNGEPGVIDFNYYNSDYGDPWWEFVRFSWSTAPNALFNTGLINGYFNNYPPQEFFEVFSYYLAYDALAAFCDSSAGTLEEAEEGTYYMETVLRWLDNMNSTVPSWYLKDFHAQYIDGIPCRLKEPFDFSFLNEYGRVFKIFDEQASGCICFGVSDGIDNYFIKFAGVRTINNYDLPVSDAVARLKAAVPKYRDLAHPLLINFIEAKETDGGYMLVFDWENGESFSVEKPLPHERFSALPADKKIYVFEEILRFHEHTAKCGYVAMDFNDYSTLYNFSTGEIKICDIDFYAKQSYINGMGRALGDPAVMSPEEFRIGGLVDEISNVYTMGATAFVLLSGNDRSPEAWALSKALYDVVKKAVNDERDKRQQSIEQLITEWKAAKFS